MQCLTHSLIEEYVYVKEGVISPCQLCSKDQTLAHLLNGCTTALELRQYNDRHGSILESIYSFLRARLPKHCNIIVDLPGYGYIVPQNIAPTNDRPDIVLWNSTAIELVKLIISYDTEIEDAVSRKQSRHASFKEACKSSGHNSTIATMEVGFRCFLNMAGFTQLYKLVKANAYCKHALFLSAY